MRRPAFPSLTFGALPVDAINKALGTELAPGIVRLSRSAHRHMAEDHADAYADCFAALRDAIANPSFVGQAPEQTRNFEIVRRLPRPDRQSVLVAVGIEPDDHGAYRVKSCYLIRAETVDRRRLNGTLKQIPL